MSAAQVVAQLQDGMTLGIGGWGPRRKPMALVREILRSPLKDLTMFNAVSMSPEGYTLIWPNGADFDPATLHDWPEFEAEFVQMARSWADNRE